LGNGMIGQIAKKEIHHNLYSIRFPALLVISAILFIFNGILAVTEPAQKIFKLNPNTIHVIVSRQRDNLQFCARGTSADRAQSVDIRIGGVIEPQMARDPSELPGEDRLGRFALPYADHIDWIFIIKMIFGLFAIIFTFDAVCWERERGTLTLMCANPVSRSSVLLGKYLGICGTLFIPLAVGIVFNLLIIVIAGGIAGTMSLQTEHWLRISLLVLASVIYISLFVFLGLLVSTAVKKSSSSLLILLSFWVALIIAYPNLAGILAEHASETGSGYQLGQRRRRPWMSAEARELHERLNKQIDGGEIMTQEELDRASEAVFIGMTKIINDAEAKHRDALTAKRRSARRIAMASPAAIYQYVCEAIADSGFERQQRFLKSISDYYLVYENYVREKVGKVVPWSSVLISMGREVAGKKFVVRTPSPEAYKGYMSDFPYFSERRWSIIDSLRSNLDNLFILFLWNILFFVAAHYVFLKRSLR
jgi:ABC-type transport system involved in multi-copper enzyme maturation permease subunit